MIDMLVYDAFRFAVFIRDGIRDDLNGTVRAVDLAYSATVAPVLIILIMHKDQFTLEAVKHFEMLPVLGVFLRDNLPGVHEIIAGDPEPFPE